MVRKVFGPIKTLFICSKICLGDISSGLVANDRDWFELNGKKFRIFSGSLHYFRVHPDYWRDRLKKYRAAGLNAIDV